MHLQYCALAVRVVYVIYRTVIGKSSKEISRNNLNMTLLDRKVNEVHIRRDLNGTRLPLDRLLTFPGLRNPGLDSLDASQ